MSNFFYKNRYKFVLVLLLAFLVLGLSSCRFDSSYWYEQPYETYANEWVRSWNNGSGWWNTLWASPIILISWPIAFICSSIGKLCGNSYFWGIFFTTIIVRTCAWPIYSKQNGMSLKMQLMQPEMSKVQLKYQGRQDPRSQQMMQQEMMAIYKKYKVNPLGCFTTMILQFPIFMSMYEVVQRVNADKVTKIDGAVTMVEHGRFALLDTKIFGYFEMNTGFFEANATTPDKIFSVVIALTFGGITMLQQKLSQRPPKYQKKRPNQPNQKNDQQKQMQMMMNIMNIMFVFMALSNTSLAIYWLIGAVYQIFQAQIGRKINEWQYYKLKEKNNL